MALTPLKLAAAATTLLLSSSVALAIPFSSFDPRTMAMGGAGVAVADAATAPLFNPALLSITRYSDDFSLVLPVVGVRVADPDDLFDSIDQFQNNNYAANLQTAISSLDAAITAATAAPSAPTLLAVSSNSATVAANLSSLSQQLAAFSDKPVTIEAGVATVVGIPNKRFGYAFYASRLVAAGGVFQYQDSALIAALAAQASCLSTAAAIADPPTAAAAITACGTPAFITDNLQSGINFKGVMFTEAGFSFSREFRINRELVSLGITPKIVKAQIYEVPLSVNSSSLSGITSRDYLAEYSMPNLDLGIAKNYRNGWRAGLVVKNLIPYSVEFKNAPTPGATPVATGSRLKLLPQTRIGISHTNRWSTVALDVDVYRNDPVGLEDDTQYIALGGELNGWNWGQLRAGYRMDLVNSNRNIASIGLGFSPFGVHADLALAGNAHELGLSFQLGFRF
jgi:F plasmid transfer operon, TraF, protein